MTDDTFDRYAEIRDANGAYVGGHPLRFYLRIDAYGLVREIERDRRSIDLEVVDAIYSARIKDALGPIAAESGTEVVPEPWRGGKTGGSIPDQQYAIQVVGYVLAGMATIVLLVDFADVVRRHISKARDLSKNDVLISDGHAVILAADAIFERTGERDMTLAIAAPMNRYLPDVREGWSTFDGWLIGFRSRERMYLAHVDWHGNVTVADEQVDVSWRIVG